MSQLSTSEAFDRDARITGSPLLNLPAELRNAIYEYVLPKEEHAFWMADCYKRKVPGILLANKQIRSEALPIFYQSNIWVRISDLDLSCPTHWLWAPDHPFDITVSHDGYPSWPELKVWLRAYFDDGRVLAFTASTPGQVTHEMEYESDVEICDRAFKIVEGMREAGSSWELVDKVLEEFKGALDAVGGLGNWWRHKKWVS